MELREALCQIAEIRQQMARLAAEQFFPCVAVGAVLTLASARGAREGTRMLPGLWSLVFSLGIFASYRLLPLSSLFLAPRFALQSHIRVKSTLRRILATLQEPDEGRSGSALATC